MVEQSGVIAVRGAPEGTQVVLISSRRVRDRWVIPKGCLEPDLSPARSAELEAYEEAGVRGPVDPHPLGSYRYHKRGCELRVQVFRMEVQEILADWPEKAERSRVWLAPEEAAARVKEAELQRLLLSVAAHSERGPLHLEPDDAAEKPLG